MYRKLKYQNLVEKQLNKQLIGKGIDVKIIYSVQIQYKNTICLV